MRNPFGRFSCLLVSVAAGALLAFSPWETMANSTKEKQKTSDVTISFQADAGTNGRFEVRGLSAEELQRLQQQNEKVWKKRFVVFVKRKKASEQTPMLGNYSLDKGMLSFEPRFPLQPGVTYQAVLYSAKSKKKTPSERVARFFRLVDHSPSKPTSVSQVYPTRTLVPENLLKLYLHFSAPMSRGKSYQHIHLLREDGKPVELPFLELGEELWNGDGTRLTVFFDPGRIKRGLKPREEEGPILEEGKNYILLIDADWRDARGNPLKEEVRKKFRAGPPDERQPDPEKWSVKTPVASSKQPLVLRFQEPLDHAMLQRVITVESADGETLSGKIEIDREETRWRLTPKQPWQPGNYRIVVETTLEDRAGNSIGRPFEIDVFRTIEREVVPEHTSIMFTVRLPRDS